MIDVELLKNMSSNRSFKNGQVIIEDEDTVCDEMYIILKGTVDVYKNYNKPECIKVAALPAGSFFGEMSLFLNKGRTATVVAAEDTILLAINRLNAYEFFEKQPAATFLLIKSLCARLEGQTSFYGKSYINRQDSLNTETDINDLSLLPDIFPEGHKNYSNTFEPDDPDLLFEKGYICPMCYYSFKALTVKYSALKLDHTDRDFRSHYSKIEPIYYDVLTCPKCWYSTLLSSFQSALPSRADVLNKRMLHYKSQMILSLNEKREANQLFIVLYLALECTQICFPRPEMIKAKLWLRISWLYHDCGDEKMELYAIEQTYKAYLYVYEKTEISPNQMQQLQLLIGELSFKLKDYQSAKRFLYLAKVYEPNKPYLRSQADERLEEIKALKIDA